MKRTVLAIIALLTLLVGFAQLQNFLPVSVQRFIDERADRERLLNTNPYVAESFRPQFCPPRIINGTEMVDAFVDIEDKTAIDLLRQHGVIVNCEFDDFITAQVPVSFLDQITAIPGVKGIEISKMLELCTDTTLSVTHAGQVINGANFGLPQGYDGSGVIIGIIDSGFDYQHLAFRSADDNTKTRIKRIYDPADSTGHPVYIGGNQLEGTVFMGEQIDTMTYDIKGTHGTHTTSIAAGMHVNGYGGMAPGADIVLCSVRNMNLLISEAGVVNAMKYIYSYADSVGKPCVISLSVSSVPGPHDGNDRISKAVASLVGPGRIFVIAAGNNGYTNKYAYGPVTKSKPLNMVVGQYLSSTPTDYTCYYSDVFMDTWVRGKSQRGLVKFHIFDKQTKRIVWMSDLVTLYKKFDSSEFSQYFVPDTTVDSEGYLSAVISTNSSSKYEIQCYVHNLRSTDISMNEGGVYCSRYQIGLTFYPPSAANPRLPDSCYIDSWMAQGSRIAYYETVLVDEVNENGDTVSTQAVDNFYLLPNDQCCINSYAVHDSIISAGAFVGRNSFFSLNENRLVTENYPIGSLYAVSSYQAPGYGPTGKHLPTVMAPGFFVVAAASRYSYFNSSHRDLVMRLPSGDLWGAMSGTSMASPTVAGIIAQWLQLEPELSPGEAKKIIAETAIKDNYTQSWENGSHFGPNGKIDAMAGIKYILEHKENEILLGDVNGNGSVTIKDVTMLITYLLYDDPTSIVFLNSDLNQDGQITIKDLVLLVNLLLE